MVQGVAGVAPNDGDIHIPRGWSGPLYVHISLGKIDLLSYFIKIVSLAHFISNNPRKV